MVPPSDPEPVPETPKKPASGGGKLACIKDISISIYREIYIYIYKPASGGGR